MRTVCKAVRDRKSYLGCNNSDKTALAPGRKSAAGLANQ